MERILVVKVDALVEVVADLLEATVEVMGAEIDSLEEIVKGQDEDIEGLLHTIECQEEEIDAMTHYITELEMKLALVELFN